MPRARADGDGRRRQAASAPALATPRRTARPRNALQPADLPTKRPRLFNPPGNDPLAPARFAPSGRRITSQPRPRAGPVVSLVRGRVAEAHLAAQTGRNSACSLAAPPLSPHGADPLDGRLHSLLVGEVVGVLRRETVQD
jgi:hypothetical protein